MTYPINDLIVYKRLIKITKKHENMKTLINDNLEFAVIVGLLIVAASISLYLHSRLENNKEWEKTFKPFRNEPEENDYIDI